MKVIGITGSLAAGKTTATRILAQMGIPTWEADMAVHRLLEGKAKRAVIKEFGKELPSLLLPHTAASTNPTLEEAINRKVLGGYVFANPKRLKRLEAILHPLVVQDRKKFINSARHNGAKLAVVDIPLLFEGGGNHQCHHTILIAAPNWLRKHRACGRGLSTQMIHQITARQLPQAHKAKLADFVIANFLGRAYLKWRLRHIIKRLVA